MNIALMSLAGLGLLGSYVAMKRKDPSINTSSCFFEKLAYPLYHFFNEYHSNSLFLIDSIKENSILCNTPFGELYGIEINSGSTLPKFVNEDIINSLIRNYKDDENAFFFYVMHNQGKFQKQYIFSYNENIVKTIGRSLGVQLLSGQELCNVLYNLYLQNNFFESNKKLITGLKIEKDSIYSEPEFMAFKRLARQAILRNFKEVDIYQGFKHLDIKSTSINQIFKLKFEGAIWFYFDISKKQIDKHIDKLINYSKLVGDKKPFVDLKESYNKKEQELLIVNAVAYLKNYEKDVIGQLESCLKTSFIQKELHKTSHLQKSPLKFRDDEFDFIVKSDFLNNFISSIHKKECDKPDIYGIDKNGAFINYSFSKENRNGHSCILAKSGAGKSFSKQKMITQLIELDISSGKCLNLGKEGGNVRVRSYDIGFSDQNLVNLIQSNPENKVAYISSTPYTFSYNIVGFQTFENKKLFEKDLQFNTDLISVILETQNSEALTINESSFFKTIVRDIYSSRDFQRYRVSSLKLKNPELYNEILSLNYRSEDYLEDLKESKFNFLKTPLLNDVVKIANKEGQNQQLKEEERRDYLSLSRKLSAIEKLDLFSHFDRIDIQDADFLYMDLNDFKETSLFVPIFLSIFQKTYLKDRDYALSRKSKGLNSPKLFYAIEEAANYFRVNFFVTMFAKLAREARKYNVHLCFITQDANDIPKEILKNLNTRIFLLEPSKKEEAIDEAMESFNIPIEVENALRTTDEFEMCFWYSKGVFHMKFDISPEEHKLFSTNPEEGNDRNDNKI